MPIEHIDSRGARQIKPKYESGHVVFRVAGGQSSLRLGPGVEGGASLVSLSALVIDDIVSVKCGLSTYDHAYDDHDDDVVCCGRKSR